MPPADRPLPFAAEDGAAEERFRALLDDRGVLRAGALTPPDRSTSLTVFSQAGDASLDLAALRSHASRFFGAKLGLTVDKRYGGSSPDVDAARVVLSAETSGTRLVFGRPRDEGDLSFAEAAERASGATGMSLLASRCPTVWLVVLDADPDLVALRIAAIFASVMLGPIVTPDGQEVFGVRTARLKLEGRARPYR